MTKLSMTVKTDDVTSGTMDGYPHRRVGVYGLMRRLVGGGIT